MRVFLMVGILATAITTSAAAQAPDGKALYDEFCKKCHGVIGSPPQTMVKKFEKIKKFDAEFMAKRTDDSVVKVLTKGKNEDMKSFKDKMKPEEMAAVSKYVHELAAKAKP